MSENRSVFNGVPKDIVSVIREFNIKPIPGRFFARPVHKSRITKKPTNIEIVRLKGPQQKKNSIEELESIYYDHPFQLLVVAVGDDFDRGAEYKEKMFVKKGDIIAARELEIPPIIYKGHYFLELNQSLVLAILGNDPKFECVTELK